MRQALILAHNAVIQVERRVDEALRVGVEAADKSVARIATYDILGSLSGESTSGIPFFRRGTPSAVVSQRSPCP